MISTSFYWKSLHSYLIMALCSLTEVDSEGLFTVGRIRERIEEVCIGAFFSVFSDNDVHIK